MFLKLFKTATVGAIGIATLNAQSFTFSTAQTLVQTPRASVFGNRLLTFDVRLDSTLSGQVVIDAVSGLVSVLGTFNTSFNTSFGSLPQQSALISETVFYPNPFPIPGGHTTTSITGVVIQPSLSSFPVSQTFSVSGVTPVFVSPNLYQIPLPATSLSGPVSFNITDYGSLAPGNTAQVSLDMPLDLYINISNYPTSVAVTSFIRNSFPNEADSTSPAGTQVHFSSVPEPRDFAMISVFACVATFGVMRRKRAT
jgi:hypothetical protein